jgi:hypothetical protein
MKTSLCNCIALYDYNPERCNLKEWFEYMDQWVDEIGVPWESIGSNLGRKLLLYKNGRRKYEKLEYIGIDNMSMFGGVSEPGTYLDWKTHTSFFMKDNGLRQTMDLCFPDTQKPFTQENLVSSLKHLLEFADFQYGICYQRPYNMGPSLYAAGALGGKDLSAEEENKIGAWSLEYTYKDGAYRTGLLRDVYPFNILVATHLTESVGDKTLESWIDSDSRHGSLDKITNNHWLWSVEPQHIPLAQEALQKAGLLLCYKV